MIPTPLWFAALFYGAIVLGGLLGFFISERTKNNELIQLRQLRDAQDRLIATLNDAITARDGIIAKYRGAPGGFNASVN